MKIKSIHHEPKQTQSYLDFPLSKLHLKQYFWHTKPVYEPGDYPVVLHERIVLVWNLAVFRSEEVV